jgi:predicted GNAT superfamily acetyltransferase
MYDSSPGISIRPLDSMAEYHACEELQRRVWAMPDDLDVVPLHLLLSVQKGGGVLLGAYQGDQLVGFVFGFPGLTARGRLKHCSHMMAVTPELQSRGIGHQLKLAQRQAVREQGLDLVTWTYDPLESLNAYLNIAKLGTICRTYIQDLYGPMTDGLNAGMPSDRFQVEWWVSEPRVERRLGGGSPLPQLDAISKVNITQHTAAGLLSPGRYDLSLGEGELAVEIPADYRGIKLADPPLALEWRQGTRQIFESYFAKGFAVTDFVSRRDDHDQGRRSYYLLTLR